MITFTVKSFCSLRLFIQRLNKFLRDDGEHVVHRLRVATWPLVATSEWPRQPRSRFFFLSYSFSLSEHVVEGRSSVLVILGNLLKESCERTFELLKLKCPPNINTEFKRFRPVARDFVIRSLKKNNFTNWHRCNWYPGYFPGKLSKYNYLTVTDKRYIPHDGASNTE